MTDLELAAPDIDRVGERKFFVSGDPDHFRRPGWPPALSEAMSRTREPSARPTDSPCRESSGVAFSSRQSTWRQEGPARCTLAAWRPRSRWSKHSPNVIASIASSARAVWPWSTWPRTSSTIGKSRSKCRVAGRGDRARPGRSWRGRQQSTGREHAARRRDRSEECTLMTYVEAHGAREKPQGAAALPCLTGCVERRTSSVAGAWRAR